MRAVLSRLRAALTPQAIMLLAALLMTAAVMTSSRQEKTSPLEQRISRTLSAMDGAGSVIVTIREREIQASGGAFAQKDVQYVPCGAVAVAQGADDPVVAMQVRDALCALLGLPLSAVSVLTGGR